MSESMSWWGAFWWARYLVFVDYLDWVIRLIPTEKFHYVFHSLHVFLIWWYKHFEHKKSPELRSVEWTVNTLTGVFPVTRKLVVLCLDLFNMFWPPLFHFQRRRDVLTAGRRSIFVDRPCGIEKPTKDCVVCMYAYGGSFLGGDAESQVNFAQGFFGKQAQLDGCMLVEYGRWPRKVDDMLEVVDACYKWLLDRGYKPENIYVGGLSSGGCLCFLYFLKCIEENRDVPLPAGMYGFAPILDFTMSTESIDNNRDVLIVPGVVNILKKMLPEFTNFQDRKKISAIHMKDEVLAKMPPVALVATLDEIIIDELNIFQRRLKENNVPCESLWIPHVNFHGLTLFAAFFPPEALDQLDFIANWFDRMRNRNSIQTVA